MINYAENYLSQQSLLSTDIRHVFVVNLHIYFRQRQVFHPCSKFQITCAWTGDLFQWNKKKGAEDPESI